METEDLIFGLEICGGHLSLFHDKWLIEKIINRLIDNENNPWFWLYVSKFPTQTAVLLVKVLSGHKKTEICGHTSTRGISHPFVLL